MDIAPPPGMSRERRIALSVCLYEMNLRRAMRGLRTGAQARGNTWADWSAR
jgi:hypothetical protein